MFILASLTLTLWLLLTADWLLGIWQVDRLTLELKQTDLPTLSVVIPALNEEGAIESSLKSVLAQAYPGLEVIAINDRSTDRTGAILDRLQKTYPQLQVVHIEALPAGWLGKNHALYLGAQKAQGEWLLFTDADVKFQPGALGAAVSYALEHKLEHLTAVPHMAVKSPWLKSFVAAFMLLFSFGIMRASAPATNAYVGLGAFNLLRRSVYKAVGGHTPIALRPDDDMMLGKLVKRAGLRQRVVFATELMQVEWYTSVREAVQGLNKNAFAGLSYSLPLVLLVTGTLLVTHIFPFFAVFLTAGWTQLVYALVLLNILLVYALGIRLTKLSPVYAALHPLGTAILVYATLESAFKALGQGGIRWRGTFYSLEALKKNTVKSKGVKKA